MDKRKKKVLKKYAVIFFGVTAFLFLPVLLRAQTAKNAMPDSLRKHVKMLCSTSKPRQYKNLKALGEASNYITGKLTQLKYKPVKQVFQVNQAGYHNIIATYGDTTKEKIVVGAHYDVCEDQPGADDNASGVAGLLELADLFSVTKPDLPYCLEMVFYTLEEPPFFRTEHMGSYVHAKSLHDKNAQVKLMISLEMIGYFSDEKNSQHYPVSLMKLWYPNTGNFIAVVGKSGMKKHAKTFRQGIRKGTSLPAEMLIAPAKMAGVDFSDHLNYWAFGFAAVMITDSAFMRNSNYHSKTDTPETLDYDRMAEVVRGVFYTLTHYPD